MGKNFNSQLKAGDLALVIGGSGFIGSYLVKSLQDSGIKVRIFARRSFERCRDDLVSRIESPEWVTGDLCDLNALTEACSNASVVFHVAGIAHISSKAAADMFRVNVQGTRIVAEACVAAAVPKLVYLSSALATRPDSSTYANSKKKAEDILLGESGLERAGVHVTILRPTNVYGRGMRGNIAKMIKFIQRRHLPPLPKLNNRLTLVSISDICRVALLAATKSHASGQIFEVTDGVNYTPSQIESAVYSALKRKSPRWRSPRVLFYAGSLAAEGLNKLGIWRSDLGLRTYRNLVSDNPLPAQANITQLDFVPCETLYTAMPEILELTS